jgi:hypothetical protein
MNMTAEITGAAIISIIRSLSKTTCLKDDQDTESD